MRLYRLFRQEDVSGVSGTGLVAEVCAFSSGKVTVSFLPGAAGVSNVIVYDALDDVIRIHGHDGKTRLIPVSVSDYARERPGDFGVAA